MISILIPTYNYDVSLLVKELHQQLTTSNYPFEIIISDDGSLSELNKKNNILNNLNHVCFNALSKNIGLSNNRNLLAKASKYNYLLFIDGDSIIHNPKYIETYFKYLNTKTDILYGGRIHPEKKQKNRELRWKFGRQREDLLALKHENMPYKFLFFNNTIVSKSVFNTIGFNKNITQYGHEDTIFAFTAKQLAIKIKHINNPVTHGDVDLSNVFIYKTEKSLQNLLFIYNNNLLDFNFVTLLKHYNTFKRYKLNYPLAIFYKTCGVLLKKQLKSSNPSLFVFDLFRISYFSYNSLKDRL